MFILVARVSLDRDITVPEPHIVARVVEPFEIEPKKEESPVPRKPLPSELPRPVKKRPPMEHDEPPKTWEGEGDKRTSEEPGETKDGDGAQPLQGDELKLAEKKAVEELIKGQKGEIDGKDKEKAGGEGEPEITFSTQEFRYYGYKMRLKEKIQHIWRVPPEAARKGIYADLYIRFTILKNGKLGAVELLRTSGYKSLDDAAMKALRDAAPYWPLPDEWKEESFTITGHFIYGQYSYYLR
ncbi:MAG: TonB family protein [Thermodesulfovibrionales bacterium]